VTTRTMSPELHERFEREALPYRAQLLRSALQMTRHHQDAEDLVQEALTRAWDGFHRFSQGTNVRAWLHRIMLNTFITSYRKRQHEPLVFAAETDVVQACAHQAHPSGASASAEESALAAVPAPALVMALRELPAEFQQVVYLVDVEGLSYREAAATMNTPLGTVMSRLHRARAALRERLAGAAGGAFV
jgi:RNA polymerase sigma-70 factor, ECF subfamily